MHQISCFRIFPYTKLSLYSPKFLPTDLFYQASAPARRPFPYSCPLWILITILAHVLSHCKKFHYCQNLSCTISCGFSKQAFSELYYNCLNLGCYLFQGTITLIPMGKKERIHAFNKSFFLYKLFDTCSLQGIVPCARNVKWSKLGMSFCCLEAGRERYH